MFKKILKISLLIIFVGFVSAFIRGYKAHSDTKEFKEQVITSNNEVQKQDLIDEETITSILNTNEESEETNNPIQEEQKSSEKKTKNSEVIIQEDKTPIQNTEEQINTNETIIDNVEEKEVQVQEEVSIEDTNNQNENSNNNSVIYEFEDPVPTIDEEYLALLEYVDYSADEYSICYSNSIDVALTDTINIRNTSCEQFAYNGEIVGYKIKIFYRDGTSGFYK